MMLRSRIKEVFSSVVRRWFPDLEASNVDHDTEATP
jgi:hypothetical protein